MAKSTFRSSYNFVKNTSELEWFFATICSDSPSLGQTKKAYVSGLAAGRVKKGATGNFFYIFAKKIKMSKK